MAEESAGAFRRLLPHRLRAQLERRPALAAVAFNSGWLLFDKFARLLLGVVVGIWLARYLGPQRFGEFTYVVAYVAFFQAVANLGIDGVVVRDIARGQEAPAPLLATAFALRLAAGAACWLLAVAAMALAGGDAQDMALTALIGAALLFQPADVVDLWFQSQSQSRRTVTAKFLAFLLANGAKALLILLQAPLVAFAAVAAAEACLSAAGLFVAYRRFPAAGRWHALGARGRRLLAESWHFMLSGVAVIVYMRIDQILLKETLGESVLGVYAAALQLSQVWHVLPMTLATSLAPFIAEKRSLGVAAYEEALLGIFRLFGAAALAISAATALLSPLLVGLLYGPAYAEAAPILAIHVFSNLFVFQGVAQGLWLVNENRGRLAVAKTLLGAGVAVVANLLLLPSLGAKGAAVAALLSFGVSAVFANAFFAPRILAMQFGFRPAAARQ